MNKKLIVVAIGAALTGSAFAQSSNVTLYGRINTAIESNSTGQGGSEVAMRSYSSRLGVRGVEDLGDGMKGVFGIETQFNSDTSPDNGAFTAMRNAYVGLDTGKTGRVVLGRLDAAVLAPLYNQLTGVLDLVGYDAQANAFVMANGRNLGAGATVNNSGVRSQDDSTLAAVQRRSNAIGYQVKLGDVDVQARLAMLGGANDATTGGVGENNARNFELAANYKTGALTLGGGLEAASYSKTAATGVTDTAAEALFDQRLQGVIGYDLGFAKVGATFARNEITPTVVGAEKTGNEFGLSGTLPLSPKAALVANYGTRELLTNTAAAQAKRTQYALGARYDLSKRTQLWTTFNRTDADDKIAGNEVKTVTVGVRHNF
jgi:predicted porin